jgi:hypothetical protein
MPRFRQEEHPDPSDHGPDRRAAPATQDRDAERAEELQGAGGAQRDSIHRCHEEHRHRGDDGAKRQRRGKAAAAESPGMGPNARKQDESGEGEAQTRGALRAHVVKEPDRCGDPELNADHRHKGHAGAGAARSHAHIFGYDIVHVHVDLTKRSFDKLERWIRAAFGSCSSCHDVARCARSRRSSVTPRRPSPSS